jgi:hypothetical protein
MTYTTRLFLIIACCLTEPSAAYAGAVYTWVDPDGVTHFSETPPPEPGVPARMIELPPLPPPPPEDADYYSIIRQAERMEKRRLESERLEAERQLAEAEARRARMEAEAAAQPPASYPDEGTVYLPAYPYYPRFGRGHGDKPWRPGERPGGPGHWTDQPAYGPGRTGHWTDQPAYGPGRTGHWTDQPAYGPRRTGHWTDVPAYLPGGLAPPRTTSVIPARP